MKLQGHDDLRERRAGEAIRVLRKAGHKFGAFLLDLGCGPGYLSKKFLETGSHVIGTDISFTNLMTAKKVAGDCNFIQCDGAYLPFKDSVFSTIICNDVLEHTPYSNAYPLIRESGRVLGFDGKIYLSVMNRWEILEPHWLIPFFTWMPRSLWDFMFPILAKTSPRAKNFTPKFRYSENYFPYTRSMLKNLLKELDFHDITNFYATEKISDPNYIGSRFARFTVKVLKALKLTPIAFALAQRMSVLLFLCSRKSI